MLNKVSRFFPFFFSLINWLLTICFVLIELKADFRRQMTEKDGEMQTQATEWQNKLDQAREEFDSQISTMQSNHATQLAANCEHYETALSHLEQEKNEIVEGLLSC